MKKAALDVPAIRLREIADKVDKEDELQIIMNKIVADAKMGLYSSVFTHPANVDTILKEKTYLRGLGYEVCGFKIGASQLGVYEISWKE